MNKNATEFMATSHPLVELARKAIRFYVAKGEELSPPDPPLQGTEKAAGVFVSIHRHGQLRGCVGTIEPTYPSVAEEVIRNAIAAASRDPRFEPIAARELVDLEVKVDVLSLPEAVAGVDELDPKRFGLIVQSKIHPWKRGLLLPDLEGINTVEEQVHHTRYFKAGITNPEEPVQLYRFEVQRYT